MKHILAVRCYLFQAQIHRHLEIHGVYPTWSQMREFFRIATVKAANYSWPKMPSRYLSVSLA